MHDKQSKICLVTGGLGFIGSHIVDSLLEQGYRVRVLDNLSTGKRSNVHESRNLEVIIGDVRDAEIVREACKGVYAVFHKAAITSVRESITNPFQTYDVNVNGLINTLDAAVKCRVKKFVFASSAAVYGNHDGVVLAEDNGLQPISPYGLSKKTGEEFCQMYAQHSSMRVTCLRYFNVYGERQRGDSPYSSVISKFFTQILNQETITVFGDGEQTRDFVNINDVKQANMLALSYARQPFNVFNVATGKSCSLNTILAVMHELTDTRFDVIHSERKIEDILNSMASIRKIEYHLGYKPSVSLYQGLEQYFMTLAAEQAQAHKFIA